MGSQKTEGKAFAIIAVLYHGSTDLGIMMVPVIVYHSMQMVRVCVKINLLKYCRMHEIKLLLNL